MRVRMPSLRWPARLAAAVLLGVLLVRFGAGPFAAGLQRLTGFAVLAALGLTAVATVVSAWRWSLLSRAMGSPLPLGTAIASYYRSQLLNSVLPGGVTGDVERGLRSTGLQGRRLHGLRVVAWDRGAAQLVQLAVIAAVLLASAGPLRIGGGVVAAALGTAIGGALLVRRSVPRSSGGRAARAAASFRQDLHRIAARPGTVLGVVGASLVVVLLHASVFVLAAAVTVGSFDPVRMLPLALAVQAVMAIPVGLGGLGPREGMAAVVFAGAGLGAAQGVTAAIAYGALALIAVLPGVIPLLLAHRHRLPAEGGAG